MAEKLNHSSIFYFTFSLLISTSFSVLTLPELEAAIFALRANGFNLFANSIAVSDLSVQILSHKFNSTAVNSFGRHGFTFLSPPNSAIFSLDLSTDAFTYVHSLRFHVLPRRLSLSEFYDISLSSFPYVETLVPGHLLFVASSSRRVVFIDGVRISLPDLYLRSEIAVHGLDGLLVASAEEYFHRLGSDAFPPSILSPTPTPSSAGDDFKSSSVPASFPAPFEAFSPGIDGFMAYAPEIDRIPVPIEALSPGTEARSPIGGYSQEYEAIPASHDVAFTGETFNSISIPPIDAYSPENDGIPAPSPSMEFLSPDEYSISPIYDDWSGTEFLSPQSWSPVTVGDWPRIWEDMNQNEKHLESGHEFGQEFTNLEEGQGQGDENGWRSWEF